MITNEKIELFYQIVNQPFDSLYNENEPFRTNVCFMLQALNDNNFSDSEISKLICERSDRLPTWLAAEHAIEHGKSGIKVSDKTHNPHAYRFVCSETSFES